MTGLEKRINKVEITARHRASEHVMFDWPDNGAGNFQQELADALNTGVKVYVIGAKGATPEGVIRLTVSEAYKRMCDMPETKAQVPAMTARDAYALLLSALAAA